MALPKQISRLTEAEYLEIERAADIKSEFLGGEMFAMSGGTARHSLIAINVQSELRAKFKGRCVPFNSDLRIKVEATGLFTYPDVSVVCGPLEFLNDTEDVLLNPGFIAEVLSDSTEAYDRGKKFEHYRRIPALQDYLLIDQKEPRVELYSRQDSGDWLLHEASGLDSSITLPSLAVELALSDVFANVDFGKGPRSAAE